jgi:hypothetical protein
MPLPREEAKGKHTAETGHDDFVDTMYGVICSPCHNYIVIDHTNCPATCREHEACRQAYGE